MVVGTLSFSCGDRCHVKLLASGPAKCCDRVRETRAQKTTNEFLESECGIPAPHLCSMFAIPFSTNVVSVGGSECFDKTFFLSLLFFPAWSTGPAARRERRERGPHTYKIDTNTCLFLPHYAALHNVKKAPPGRGYEKRVGLGNLSLLLSLFIWFLYISFGLLPFFYTWCGAVP